MEISSLLVPIPNHSISLPKGLSDQVLQLLTGNMLSLLQRRRAKGLPRASRSAFNCAAECNTHTPCPVWLALSTPEFKLHPYLPAMRLKIAPEAAGAWILPSLVPIPQGPMSVFLQDHHTNDKWKCVKPSQQSLVVNACLITPISIGYNYPFS